MSRKICLGTALWGWSVDKLTAFTILDEYYQQGGRYVDTANNYPLNSDPSVYQSSALFLSAWIQERNVSDLKIFFKVGSLSNQNTAQNDLSYDYLTQQITWAKDKFGLNLHSIMIHWDKRTSEQEIAETCKIVPDLVSSHIELGLSGIDHPNLYLKTLIKYNLDKINVQTKFNFINNGVKHYDSLSSLNLSFWAYGISISGLKLSESEYRDDSYVKIARASNYHENVLTENLKLKIQKILKKNSHIKSVYHLALAFSENAKSIDGYLVAPSSLSQMKDIFNFLRLNKTIPIDLSGLN